MTDEKLIERYMKSGRYTREQAIELIEYDKAIDRGEQTPYDLTAEQKKNQKKIRNTLGSGKVREASPITKVKKPRERKADLIKQKIIEVLAQAVGENLVEPQILNNEKLIQFIFEGETYEIDLKKKRKPKS